MLLSWSFLHALCDPQGQTKSQSGYGQSEGVSLKNADGKCRHADLFQPVRDSFQHTSVLRKTLSCFTASVHMLPPCVLRSGATAGELPCPAACDLLRVRCQRAGTPPRPVGLPPLARTECRIVRQQSSAVPNIFSKKRATQCRP